MTAKQMKNKDVSAVLKAIDFLLKDNENRKINQKVFGDSKDFCEGYERALKEIKWIISTNN